MQDRSKVIQAYLLIPNGMTAKQYRDFLKAQAALRGSTVQELLSWLVMTNLKPTGKK